MDNIQNVTTELQTDLALRALANNLTEKGITDIGVIAEVMNIAKKAQLKNKEYPFERYTEFGSNTHGSVISEFSGESKQCILWCINHYLGLNRNPDVIAKVCATVMKYGTGSGTSALSGGSNSLHIEIQDRIKIMTGKESVLIFPTGYSTNLGAISAILGKNDLALFDRECHASIIDGIKLSKRKMLSFKHNDVQNLKTKLAEHSDRFENIHVFAESAYSMSGDLCPIKEIISLKEQYKFYLYIDESHTFGIYGEKGRGYCHEQGVTDKVDFIMSTFSKATASIGGFIATKEKFKTLIEWASNAVMFQACFTPADAATILASLDQIENNPTLIETLHKNNNYMRSKLSKIGFNLGKSKSPVIPIFIPDYRKLLKISQELYNEGIFSVAVVYPAVRMDDGRIRFIVNSSHTFEQIDTTVNKLESLAIKYELINKTL
ncbi:glycine C-acetyltransferase [Maribacter dokdonensis]|uniref:aminotransferase class I/II-fold pyridoxal phosphate-dependent enzyme n=1 Tax=Maribacter dokdonensis TaxID=320912 RepID=UPI001B2C1DC3|nr:aminotransferase class I/II-fold pyridoxal phosphate-dependent enzyme [Maribacter dokdonensis]CAG2532480.1 glycine C-acetyltransferase [Maribacter dokdonensis]